MFSQREYEVIGMGLEIPPACKKNCLFSVFLFSLAMRLALSIDRLLSYCLFLISNKDRKLGKRSFVYLRWENFMKMIQLLIEILSLPSCENNGNPKTKS